jgi:acetyl-CoA carboxylase biotin carboxyl carrier protein
MTNNHIATAFEPVHGTQDGAVEMASAAAADRLARTATRLVRSVDPPLRRVRIQQGDTAIELEWPDAAPPDPGGGTAAPPSSHRTAAPDHADPPETERFHIIAPMVGTFYHAPEPGAPPFVKVDDLVQAGQDCGIVEAMKLMNPIQAERAGRVVAVLVEDGQSVEYGQPLIALEPLDAAEAIDSSTGSLEGSDEPADPLKESG